MNIKRTAIKGIGCLLAVLAFLTLYLVRPVSAAAQGTITFQSFPASADQLEMTLYKVAEPAADGSYVLCEEFIDAAEDLPDFTDDTQIQEAAEKLADYAADKGLSGSVSSVDADGSVYFTDLSPAIYLAAQTGGTDQLLVQASLIQLPNGGSDTVSIAAKYQYPKGAVIVTKTDSSGVPLVGAVFALQVKNDTGEWTELAQELISDGNGQFAVIDLPLGDYRLVETKAPEGFLLKTEPVEFSITRAAAVENKDAGIYQEQEPDTAVKLTIMNVRENSATNPVSTETPEEDQKNSETEPPMTEIAASPETPMTEIAASREEPMTEIAAGRDKTPGSKGNGNSSDGETNTEQTESETSKNNAVGTGDDTPIGTFVLLLLAAILAGAVAGRRLRSKEVG
jgi:hypothetical protein